MFDKVNFGLTSLRLDEIIFNVSFNQFFSFTKKTNETKQFRIFDKVNLHQNLFRHNAVNSCTWRNIFLLHPLI